MLWEEMSPCPPISLVVCMGWAKPAWLGRSIWRAVSTEEMVLWLGKEMLPHLFGAVWCVMWATTRMLRCHPAPHLFGAVGAANSRACSERVVRALDLFERPVQQSRLTPWTQDGYGVGSGVAA